MFFKWFQPLKNLFLKIRNCKVLGNLFSEKIIIKGSRNATIGWESYDQCFLGCIYYRVIFIDFLEKGSDDFWSILFWIIGSID